MSDPAPHGSGARMPLSIRIIGRSSAPGALFVVAVAALFVFGLPLIASSLPDEDEVAVPADTTLTIGVEGSSQVTVTLSGDWTEESHTDASLLLTNAGAELSIAAPQPIAATGTPEDVIARAVADLTADVEASWVASDPIELTTDAGDSGLCVTGATVVDVAMTCAVQHGEEVSTLTATASAQVWPSLQPSVDAMVRSMRFTEAAA
ncbi:hypothetical protein [Demequina sp. NBRC 110051]|uniref:hypothetical protein n=1 Tax=Demequina sp. NBRC 110051 TaxID=1570340 RepID=UPI001180C1CF|nr:hypothetical protein [Demequina sp. NBRC 110051]